MSGSNPPLWPPAPTPPVIPFTGAPFASIFSGVTIPPATPASTPPGQASGFINLFGAQSAQQRSANTPVHRSSKLAVPDVDATDSIVTIHVGNPTSIFKVHRNTLIRSSKFLQTKDKPEWSKGEAVVHLRHIDCATFKMYSAWLYTGRVMLKQKHEATNTGPDAIITADFTVLAHAVALGEELMDCEFKDMIIDTLRVKIRKDGGRVFWTLAPMLVRTIYEGTPASSPARKLLVNVYLNHGGAAALDKSSAGPGDTSGSFPVEFLFDLSRACLYHGIIKPIGLLDVSATCQYHGHGKDEACYLNGQQ